MTTKKIEIPKIKKIEPIKAVERKSIIDDDEYQKIRGKYARIHGRKQTNTKEEVNAMQRLWRANRPYN